MRCGTHRTIQCPCVQWTPNISTSSRSIPRSPISSLIQSQDVSPNITVSIDSILITSFILGSDPTSPPKTHRMRKLASSYALMSGVYASDILRKRPRSSLEVFLIRISLLLFSFKALRPPGPSIRIYIRGSRWASTRQYVMLSGLQLEFTLRSISHWVNTLKIVNRC